MKKTNITTNGKMTQMMATYRQFLGRKGAFRGANIGLHEYGTTMLRSKI
jgi:hypothetical protein